MAAHRATGGLASAPEVRDRPGAAGDDEPLGHASNAIRAANDNDMRAPGLTGALGQAALDRHRAGWRASPTGCSAVHRHEPCQLAGDQGTAALVAHRAGGVLWRRSGRSSRPRPKRWSRTSRRGWSNPQERRVLQGTATASAASSPSGDQMIHLRHRRRRPRRLWPSSSLRIRRRPGAYTGSIVEPDLIPLVILRGSGEHHGAGLRRAPAGDGWTAMASATAGRGHLHRRRAQREQGPALIGTAWTGWCVQPAQPAAGRRGALGRFLPR